MSELNEQGAESSASTTMLLLSGGGVALFLVSLVSAALGESSRPRQHLIKQYFAKRLIRKAMFSY